MGYLLVFIIFTYIHSDLNYDTTYLSADVARGEHVREFENLADCEKARTKLRFKHARCDSTKER